MNTLSNVMFIEIVTYTLVLVAVVLLNSYLYLRAKKILMVQYFFRVQILLALWIVSIIFKPVVLDNEALWIWVLLEYFGIIFVSLEFFAFGYVYKYERTMSRNWHRALALVAVFNYLVLFTNPYHNLFFELYTFQEKVKAPLFYFHILYSYSLIFGGHAMILSSGFSEFYDFKDKLILIGGLGLPLFINILYVFDFVVFPFDLTPISFNIMLLSFGFVAFRKNYADVQLVTRLKILDNLYEGIIILDKDNNIIEYNKKMTKLTKDYIHLKKFGKFENIFKEFKPYVKEYELVKHFYHDFVKSSDTESHIEFKTLFDTEEQDYVLGLQKTFAPSHDYTGMIVKFLDMTEYHTLIQSLEEKNRKLQDINRRMNENISVNKRLVVEQERHRASKEVHDILGHSVTIVISLLEMIKSTYSKDPDFAREKVAQAMDITRRGVNELKQSLTRKKDSSITTEILIEDLERLTEEFTYSGVEVEFITNHYPIKIKPKYYDTIYRICQESMTNALRHGQAKKITIAVRFNEHSVDIIIADNGKGCLELKKGNGIKGMEQRVVDLDGFFSCGSPDGEGFNLHVTIPIARELSNINQA